MGENANTIKKNTDALLDVSEKVGVEVKGEESKL
jgi:hypothetical protein